MPRITASPVDKYIGQRVRMARVAAKRTQTELADVIHVRYQQIQKCESGLNRIAASQLFELAHYLNQPMEYFLPKPIHGSRKTQVVSLDDKLVSFYSSRDGQHLAECFMAISDPTKRGIVVSMAEVLRP